MVTISELRGKNRSIAIVGLGYVGLPLAVAFARHCQVTGFDINQARINELRQGYDVTREVESQALSRAAIAFTSDPEALRHAGVIIITVPTPIDSHRQPDLGPVMAASRTVGRYLQPGSVVVYESTVYPGVTEDICVPLLEGESGLVMGRDFSVGYSPERINPGDKVHTLETITKIVSASDAATLDLLAELYGQVVSAGIHRAASIKIAEAAKVIENTQRDINIALMNELALIFEKMNIDTLSVLEAAGTKWNFLPFRPGLVGGHCIGVDPYYLTHKAEELGYHPQIILSGRRVNDNMGNHVAAACVKRLIKLNCHVAGARVGVLGITFKENVPDIRNTRVVDIISELQEFGVEVMAHDPLADHEETLREYGLRLVDLHEMKKLNAMILAVPHEYYRHLDPALLADFFVDRTRVMLLDIKGFWRKEALVELGYKVWRL